MTDTINPQDRLDFIKREDMTPEQRVVFDAIQDITVEIGTMLNGKRLDYCLGALLNIIGTSLDVLRDNGQTEVLMRMAMGLAGVAEHAASLVHQIEAKPSH